MKSSSMTRMFGLGAIAVMLATTSPVLAEPGRGGPPAHAQQGKADGKQGGNAHGNGKQGNGKQQAGKPAERGPDRTAHERDNRGHDGRNHDSRNHDRHATADRSYWDSHPVAWDRSHRDVIVRYYDSHRVSCPPGLIETRTGCLPRGQAKKRYTIGQPLPRTVIIETLPYDLYRQLPPPPHGYIYRRVDGDVLLIAEATKKVIDAIVLFSAL